MDVIIRPDAASAEALTAEIIANALRVKPNLTLGLATGATMEKVYQRLADMNKAGALDFSLCKTFNLDEYVGLPAEDRNSYRYYMNYHLFDRINIDKRNTHLEDGTAADLEAECAHYEQLMDEAGGVDLQLLGIGLSGHIGFNEPLSSFSSRTRAVNLTPTTMAQNGPYFDPAKGEKMPNRALTMGVGTILDARKLVMLVTGERKADIIAAALEGPMTSMVSGSAIQLHDDCVVILDEAAAAKLTLKDYYRSAFENDPKWDAYRNI
ncbi:MAG: glucosamine-6-phosphate deaminase [Lentisphaeria bacterium]|nr:glucosamine-6-phosphate deaminase [Lentisphaeria bacterium]